MMLRALYDQVLALSAHPRAPRWLAAVSFAESSVFPIPPDAMLIPMCLARPDRAWRYAAICTIASVLGGIAGYAIGLWLFEALAEPVLRAYGHADALLRFEGWFQQWGTMVILIKGLTPIPYKLVTITSDLPGAEIEVDGGFVGSTPSISKLTPGSHKVTVKHGANVWSRDPSAMATTL